MAASPLGALVQDVKGGMIALVKAPVEEVKKDRSNLFWAIKNKKPQRERVTMKAQYVLRLRHLT